MDARGVAWGALEVAVIAVVASLVVGQLLGTPVLFGFVETGSMAPTMEPGDGFVAIPSALAGSPEAGDIVTFRAEELDGGGLTTHRIVGETDRGFITRGDANPFTDQDGDEPPVKEAQIVAHALQVGGQTAVIPNLGTVVMGLQSAFETVQRRLAALTGTRALLGTQGLAYFLLATSGALYVVDLFIDDGRARERSRAKHGDGIDGTMVLAGLAALLVVTATAAMVVPAGTQSIGIVSAEFDSERPTVIPAGESSTIDYQVPNAGLVPVHVYLESGSDGVAVEPEHQYVGGRDSATAALTLTAPPDTGYYHQYVTEHRYLALLPPGVIDGLYRVHPWAPIVAIDGLLAGAIVLMGRGLLGGRRIRVRRRESRHDRSLPRRVLALLTPGGDDT